MNKNLKETLDSIHKEFSHIISINSNNYLEVDIETKAKALGFDDMGPECRHACAIVPLKDPVPGMKVMIDGRGFVGYVQFESGIAVPGFVGEKSGLPYRKYIPSESMVLNVH